MCVKLHEGKRYVCRNGAVVGPLEKNSVRSSSYQFWCSTDPTKFSGQSSASWTETGDFRIDYANDDYDIVAEYHEYVWKWMVPDKPGVWMFGGCSRDITERNRISVVLDISTWPEGWYCFLMDIPQIQMPPKQRVTKRLWLRKTKWASLNEYCTSYEERWETEDITLEGWISTNVTKEVEQ